MSQTPVVRLELGEKDIHRLNEAGEKLLTALTVKHQESAHPPTFVPDIRVKAVRDSQGLNCSTSAGD